jgi:Domain of unknown function (DUF5671)
MDKKGERLLMNEELIEFVKEGRKAGRPLAEIAATLTGAGWSDSLVRETLSKFVESDFPVAVPRPVAFASPRLAALNIFHFVMLYTSVYNIIAVLFTFLDYYIPDGLGRMMGYYYSSYHSIGEVLRDNIAALIVCVPFVILSHTALAAAVQATQQRIAQMRIRFVYTTLVFGALSLVSTACCIVYYFLAGELGIRVAIKFLILAAVTAWIYLFYRTDIKEAEEKA